MAVSCLVHDRLLAPIMTAFLLQSYLPYCSHDDSFLASWMFSKPVQNPPSCLTHDWYLAPNPAVLLSSFCYIAHIMMTFLLHSRLSSCSHNVILVPRKVSFWLFIMITKLAPKATLSLPSWLLASSCLISCNHNQSFLFHSSCLLAHIMKAYLLHSHLPCSQNGRVLLPSWLPSLP